MRIFAVVMLLGPMSQAATFAQASSNGSGSGRWGAMQFIGPDTIADIATAAAPSVVNITANSNVSREQLSRMKTSGHGKDDSHKVRRYYGIDSLPGGTDSNDTLKVTGSGLIVRSNGYILTSLHVVENANSVTVTLQNGKSYEGTVTARDRFSDLAIVKIAAADLPVAKFGNPDQLRLGDWVVAIGNQFGLGHTVTHGLISGLEREAKGFEKSFGAKTGAVRFIQTDAPINPGSSGGPLLNLKGEVIGVNTFIRDDAQNIGFAVPANIAREVADKLTSAGEIAHPYIGIVMREPLQQGKTPEGVEVTEVRFRSPAASAGIVPGDVIMEVDHRAVSNSDDISLSVAKRRIGDNIKMKVKHNGADKDLDVKVDRLPDDAD